MCGIFGVLGSDNCGISAKSLRDAMNCLFKLSESRGKEASGIAARVGESIYIFKSPILSSKLIKTDEYKTIFNHIADNNGYKILRFPLQ